MGDLENNTLSISRNPLQKEKLYKIPTNKRIMLQLDSSTDSSIYISKTKMNRPMAYETFFTQDNLPNILAKSDD